jgi:hypothetical protein
MSIIEMKIDFEKADRTFANYRLIQAPLLYKGSRIPMKAILKNEKVVAIVGRGYRLLPNTLVGDVARKIAAIYRLEESGFPRVGTFNERLEYDGLRGFWTLIFPERYGFDGENLYLGIQMRNSEDGRLSFGVDLFTFREACSNGAIIRSGHLEVKTLFKHTKQLEVEEAKIFQMIHGLRDLGEAVLERYREMMKVKLNEEIFEGLKRIPKKYFPEVFQAKELRADLIEATTEWELYNDLTRNIWHNKKTSMFTKRVLNNFINRAFEIGVVR